MLYVRSRGGSLFAVDATGQLRWAFQSVSGLVRRPEFGPLVSDCALAADGTLYLRDIGNKFYHCRPPGWGT